MTSEVAAVRGMAEAVCQSFDPPVVLRDFFQTGERSYHAIIRVRGTRGWSQDHRWAFVRRVSERLQEDPRISGVSLEIGPEEGLEAPE